MIGDLIARIRSDKGISKTDLAKNTNINIGHLTHIEKGERNPSHKALKSLALALDVPYQQLMYTYDRELTEEQKSYAVVDHINYKQIPVFTAISGFCDCPSNVNSASFVLRINDDSMSPKFKVGDYVYVEPNAPLNNKDVGIFEYDNKILVRKFIIRKKDVVLRAEKDEIDEIVLVKDSSYNIVGKIIGTVSK